MPSFNQEIKHPKLLGKTVFIKREDLNHPIISGNKYRKLKYNISYAKAKGYRKIMTFGGAHSNHIAAVASYGRIASLGTIGVIRGEELACKISEIPTLRKASQEGMSFMFVSRDIYRERHNQKYISSLLDKLGRDTLYVPEGGSNSLGIKGCEEILTPEDSEYNTICCAVGTGGTLAGIINSSKVHQKIIGFSALKGVDIESPIKNHITKNNWEIISEDFFGGFARISDELVFFINDFYHHTGIPLDPIYTGKMMFRIFDLLKNDYFCRETKILIIHTGGLQAISGMNLKLIKKNKPLINT